MLRDEIEKKMQKQKKAPKQKKKIETKFDIKYFKIKC
jgi:hypothetical protein